MSAHLILRTAARADLSMPWPIRIEADGTVTHGRPDAHRLLGFQRDLMVQQIDLDFDAALEALDRDPNPAVGMFPVYVGDLGGPGVNDRTGIFVTGDAVVSLEAVGS
jgi:hypothetical protein